jgi:hypothetical protein
MFPLFRRPPKSSWSPEDETSFAEKGRHNIRWRILYRIPLTRVGFEQNVDSNWLKSLKKYGRSMVFNLFKWHRIKSRPLIKRKSQFRQFPFSSESKNISTRYTSNTSVRYHQPHLRSREIDSNLQSWLRKVNQSLLKKRKSMIPTREVTQQKVLPDKDKKCGIQVQVP